MYQSVPVMPNCIPGISGAFDDRAISRMGHLRFTSVSPFPAFDGLLHLTSQNVRFVSVTRSRSICDQLVIASKFVLRVWAHERGNSLSSNTQSTRWVGAMKKSLAAILGNLQLEAMKNMIRYLFHVSHVAISPMSRNAPNPEFGYFI